MGQVTYREMREEDAEGMLVLRNRIFREAVITAEDWAADGQTAAIALLDGEVVGAIPLATRELVIAPGMAIRAPFENGVGTRPDSRGQGIGTGMVGAAKEFLRGRADGLFVYRGGERTNGYRFYTKSGHHDLVHTRYFHLDRPTGTRLPSGASLAGQEAIFERAAELLPLFVSTYGQHGGYPRRWEGYWRLAFRSIIYPGLPHEVSLLRLVETGGLIGYAILLVYLPPPSYERAAIRVIEMATRAGDLAIAERLLEGIAAVAAERHLSVAFQASDEDPFIPVLRAVGFEDGPRASMIMGQVIDVPGFFARYWRDRLHLDGVGLAVWTPDQDHVLVQPHPGFPTLTLEMKEETLHRWLLGRIDLAARLREGTVSAFGAGEPARRAVRAAIPLTPWAYHHIDWC